MVLIVLEVCAARKEMCIQARRVLLAQWTLLSAHFHGHCLFTRGGLASFKYLFFFISCFLTLSQGSLIDTACKQRLKLTSRQKGKLKFPLSSFPHQIIRCIRLASSPTPFPSYPSSFPTCIIINFSSPPMLDLSSNSFYYTFNVFCFKSSSLKSPPSKWKKINAIF